MSYLSNTSGFWQQSFWFCILGCFQLSLWSFNVMTAFELPYCLNSSVCSSSMAKYLASWFILFRAFLGVCLNVRIVYIYFVAYPWADFSYAIRRSYDSWMSAVRANCELSDVCSIGLELGYLWNGLTWETNLVLLFCLSISEF